MIAEAIQTTNPYLKSIYNKSDKLNNEFRTPELELLWGDDKSEMIHKEEKIKMNVDVRKVYFCARLHFERKRICDKYIQPGDFVADVFCGVGPFVLMAWSKKQCRGWANDLNPFCYEFLQSNLKLNKVPKESIKAFNLDGGEFITKVIEAAAKREIKVDHFYMNLPALNIDFLPYFKDIPEEMLQRGFSIHLTTFAEKVADEFVNAHIE